MSVQELPGKAKWADVHPGFLQPWRMPKRAYDRLNSHARATAAMKLKFIVSFAQAQEMGRESTKSKHFSTDGPGRPERCTREYPSEAKSQFHVISRSVKSRDSTETRLHSRSKI